MSTNLDQALTGIASEIGPDAAEFTPPGEKHFLAEAALLDMAGSFLFAFFKGVAKTASEKAQTQVGNALGAAIGDAASNLIARLQHKAAPVSRADLAAAQSEAAAAVKQPNLSQADIDAIAKAVTAAMTAQLAKQSDPDISGRVAERVSAEGLKTLT